MKTKTQSYVVDVPLRVSEQEEARLSKRFEAARHVYNASLGEALRRLDLMRESRVWQAAKAIPKTVKKAERKAAFAAVRDTFGFHRGGIQKFAEMCRDECWIGDHLGSHDTQTTSLRAFRAVEQFAYGKRGRPRFKGRNRLNSVEGKANTVIRFRVVDGERLVLWGDLSLPLLVEKRDQWLNEALDDGSVKYVRVVRRRMRGQERWWAQIVMEGHSPAKAGREPSPKGVVGLDIGPSTVAVVADHAASLNYFAPQVAEMGAEIRRIQRSMDRSRRATNPAAFAADGTYKAGVKMSVRSRRYRRRADQKAEIERRLAAERKRSHGELANAILKLGNVVKTEALSYRSFQKNFGKSVGRRAPGQFVSTLKRKAESAGARVVEVGTRSTRLSQFDHKTQTYTKKPLSQRWHQFADGTRVQRDIYSAWLVRFVEEDILNAPQCQEHWATAEPLLQQAALRSPICKQSGLCPDSRTGSAVRQSGSPVESEP